MNININYTPTAAREFLSLATGKQITNALRLALLTVSRWLNTQIRREVAIISGLQQKQIKTRFALIPPRAAGGSVEAGVWIGTNRLPLGAAGTIVQTEYGVTAGRTFIVQHAFLARMPGAQESRAFLRKTKKRFPIQEVMIHLEPFVREAIANVFTRNATAIVDRFEAEYIRQRDRQLGGSHAVR